jgi:hypothetical protein
MGDHRPTLDAYDLTALKPAAGDGETGVMPKLNLHARILPSNGGQLRRGSIVHPEISDHGDPVSGGIDDGR